MKKLGLVLLALTLIASGFTALAEVGVSVAENGVFHGVVANGVPAGLGYVEYIDGGIAVGIFGENGEPNGFAVRAGINPLFETALEAGFYEGGYGSLIDPVSYTDAAGNTIRFGKSDARGDEMLAYGTKTYDGGMYYGEMLSDLKSVCGYGIAKTNDGSISAGVWIDGKLQGYGVYLRADGSGFVGNFVENRIDGYTYFFTAEGICYLYHYENNESGPKLNGGEPIPAELLYLSPDEVASLVEGAADAGGEAAATDAAVADEQAAEDEQAVADEATAADDEEAAPDLSDLFSIFGD